MSKLQNCIDPSDFHSNLTTPAGFNHNDSRVAKLSAGGHKLPSLTYYKYRIQESDEVQMIKRIPEVDSNNIRTSTKEFPSHSDWHRADIIAALHKTGITVVGLSRQSGLSDSSLSNVFYRSWPRGEKIISDYLGVPPSLIWPSRYPRNVSCEDEPVS